MGRPPCCDKSNVKRGPWTEEEDTKILAYVATHGTGNWASVPKKAGLQRCGKSCRLRWTNYLRPDLKHDEFTPEEEQMIITIHSQIGSRWSIIAQQLPGRTDNDVKNYWNTKLKKKLIELGIDPVTHKPISHVINSIQDLSRGCSSNGGTVDAGGHNSGDARRHKQKDPRVSCLSRDLRNVFMASMPESPLVSSQLDAAADVDAETSTPMHQDVAYDCDPSWDLLAQLRAVKLVADASQVTTTPPPPQLVHSNPPCRSCSSLSVAPPPQEAVAPAPAPAPAPADPPEFSWGEFILHGMCPLLMDSESPATSSAGTSSKPVPGEASGESTELQGKPADAGGSEGPGGAALITETERSGRAVFSSYLTGEDVMCAVEEVAAAAAGSASDIDSYVESLLIRDEEMRREFPDFLDDPFGFGCP